MHRVRQRIHRARLSIIATLSALASAASPRVASAQVDRPAHAADAPNRWYGWQVLVAGEAAAAMYLVPRATNGGQLGSTGELVSDGGLGLYMLAPASVHWAHGQSDRGISSLAMHVVGGIVGLTFRRTECSGDAMYRTGGSSASCVETITDAGVAVMVLVPLLDSLRSWERAPVRESAAVPVDASPWMTRSGGGFVLRAAF